ncbi:MAG: acetate/propionate family kinase, partial [Eubacterium sp.]|nr:acetate/propionate family kinase [Eubacterium sp.]
MKILICNAGSTSLKFKLFDMPQEDVIAEGKIERIGSDADSIFQYKNTHSGNVIKKEKVSVPDYAAGIKMFLDELLNGDFSALGSVDQIDRVGFKTVLSKDHYGVHVLDEAAIEGMKAWYPIAPAHNGPYLQAVSTMREFFPSQVFVGAFETA